MIKTKVGLYYFSLVFFALLNSLTFVYGQKAVGQKLNECKVKGEKKHPKHKIINWYRGESKLASLPPTLFVQITIKSEDIGDEKLVELTQHFKQSLCNEKRFIILIFDTKSAAQNYSVHTYLKTHPLATYLLDRDMDEERLKKIFIKENREEGVEINLPK